MPIKTKTNIEPHKQWEVQKTIYQQKQNYRLRMAGRLSSRGGGLNAFY